MKTIKFLGTILLISMVIFSCSEDTPLQPTPAADNLSTFGEIQRQVFDVSCAVSGCHAGANPAASLNLTAGNSYAQLVDVNSLLSPPLKRVDEGDSDESVLVLILEGTVSPRMPLGGTPLSQATIDSIAKWIDNGALNN